MGLLREFVRCEPTLIFDHFSFVLHNASFLSGGWGVGRDRRAGF